MFKILFVCTGNTCRSPMAEAIFKQMAPSYGVKFEVKSAGIYAMAGSALSEGAAAVLSNRNIKFDHSAKVLDLSLLQWADRIFVMTEQHRLHILDILDVKDKVFLMLPKENDQHMFLGIPDPFGGSVEVYEACLQKIELIIKTLLEDMDY